MKNTKNKSQTTSADYSAISTLSSSVTTIDTLKLFDINFKEVPVSPIDQYIKNTDALNVIRYKNEPCTPELANLVLLGYVSAVESYVRALIRSLINIDEYAQQKIESKPVSFGAAFHHDKSLLPDALMEGVSFSDPDVVKKQLESVGINSITGLENLWVEFEKICHMRHCCAHRYGRLGANNAIKFGLKAHRNLLEKPLLLTSVNLDQIAEILRTYVKTLNNRAFESILNRTAARTNGEIQNDKVHSYSWKWTWNYSKDKKRFIQYYDLFATIEDSVKSPEAKEMYRRFRNAKKPSSKKPLIG